MEYAFGGLGLIIAVLLCLVLMRGRQIERLQVTNNKQAEVLRGWVETAYQANARIADLEAENVTRIRTQIKQSDEINRLRRQSVPSVKLKVIAVTQRGEDHAIAVVPLLGEPSEDVFVEYMRYMGIYRTAGKSDEEVLAMNTEFAYADFEIETK